MASQQETTAFNSTQFILSLPSSVWHETLLPFSILVTLHAIYVNLKYKACLKNAQVSWLQGFVSLMIMTVGGSSTSAILTGNAPSWLASNTTMTTYLWIYSMMFYFPNFHQYFTSIPSFILDPILLTADGFIRANAICSSGVDHIRFGKHYNPSLNTSWVAILICGTLCGCGGGLWESTFQLASPKWTFCTPPAFLNPTHDMKMSFITTLFYALTTSDIQLPIISFTPLLDIDQGRALATLVFIGLNLIKLKDPTHIRYSQDTKNIENKDKVQ
ncbi:46336_t:CDS:2 [Gigaspora margarita]|uniref:46336_t:CDS:1 n=1 Tax=Gigaspora margarita TaxID=4874 RepID=A0ABN7UBV5_GIGMA|nr:46336_t:CDS:2 [Gigaspora margarita]